jgi:hypothetical protein
MPSHLQSTYPSELLSKLQTHLDSLQFERRSNPSNLEYADINNHQKRDHYLKYLKPDINVLGLLLMISYNKRIHHLRTSLELTAKNVSLKTMLIVTGENAAALILPQQGIPCILHCENCGGETIIKRFILEVFNHFAGGIKIQDEFLNGLKNE